ncbi:Short-chain alcohol dehydrogenase (plasmid) [Halalkaliarchaeum sp. AArc-CO]|nr:Short-chain alcohol dehydrogenase [Halalkaliarchaeum sp. AArc-CO]
MTDDLSDRTILLTGGTSGFGRVTAVDLAKRGATVAVVGRNESKGAALVERSGNLTGTIAFHQADLASQSVVRSLAESVKREYDRIDVLAHNAGLSAGSRRESPDGIELTLAVNHLAPYLLTFELLDCLRDSPDPRVVVTASDIHRRATLDFDDLQLADGYDSLDACARSWRTSRSRSNWMTDFRTILRSQSTAFIRGSFRRRVCSARRRFERGCWFGSPGWFRGVATSEQAAADRLQSLLVDRRYGSITVVGNMTQVYIRIRGNRVRNASLRVPS